MIGQRIERIKDGIARQARSEGLQEGLLEGRQKGLLEGRQEGLLEGRQKGLLEGQRHGRRRILRELIEQKFGIVDQPTESLLQEASLDHLLHWSRRVLSATTLDEIFTDAGSADKPSS